MHLLTQVSSMRAVICREYGPAEKLEVAEVPEPHPGELEVLVDVHAAAVNFPDLLIIQNRYQLSVAPPFTPGSELAGIVRAVGPGVEDIVPGDRVCGQVLIGAFAEQAILPAAILGYHSAFWASVAPFFNALANMPTLIEKIERYAGAA